MKEAQVYSAVVKWQGRVFGRFAVVATNRNEAHAVVREWISSQRLDGTWTHSLLPVVREWISSQRLDGTWTHSLLLAKMGSSHKVYVPDSDTLPESDPNFPGHSIKV